MIDVRLEALLMERGRSYYWPAKEAGVSHTTLWRLRKGKALGINFETLEKICRALECQPGDVLGLSVGSKGRRTAREQGRESPKALGVSWKNG